MFEETSVLGSEEVIITLTLIGILLVAIFRNLALLRISIKKMTKTENQKMFKQEETPVLDAQELFKQTAWKSIGFRLLAIVIAVGATVCSIFVAVMLYDVNQKLTWHIEFFGSLGYMMFWAIITFPTACGVMIYLFNKKWTFSETELTLEQREKISRHLAYFSFPHVILLPAAIIFFILLWF